MARPRTHSLISTRLRYLWVNPVVRRRVYWCVGALALLGAAWIVVTGVLASRQAKAIEAKLVQVQGLIAGGDITQARQVAAELPDLTGHADALTSGPAWWIGAQIPYIGRPLQTLRETTSIADEVGAGAIPKLLKVADEVDPAQLRSASNTVKLAPLVAARADLTAASADLHSAVRALASVPTDTWLGPVNTASVRAAGQLASIVGYVDAANRVAAVLPSMMGQDAMGLSAPRRYFIGLQNEAELRGTGGLPGAFAIAFVSQGTLTFTHFGSDTELFPPGPNHEIATGLDFGADYTAAYGASLATTTFADSNASPNFPYAAKIWAAMWERVSGQHVDGALGIDPTTLSYLLAATGPATLPTPMPNGSAAVTAENVVTLTQRDEYSLFPDYNQRKDFLKTVMDVACHRLISGSGSAQHITQALVAASKQQRLLVWSSDPGIQATLEQTSYAGQIPTADRPLSAMILNNAAAGKLDYYLTRSLKYSRTGCGPTRDVLATMTLTNGAPASGLSPYVTTRLDSNPPPNAKPGDNRTLLDYYATTGAQLQSVSLNGVPIGANVQSDLGHPIYRLDLELPRGTTQTIVLHLTEPAGSGAPLIWRQPGVTPLAVTAFSQTCS